LGSSELTIEDNIVKTKTLLPLVALALAITSPAFGATTTLLSDNFDSYANQAAFQAAWPATVGTGGTFSTLQAASAPDSVNFPLTAQRNDRSFAESGNPSALNAITFGFDFYDSNAAASPYRQCSSLIDGAGNASGMLVSLGMNNNQTSANSGGNYYMARILGYTVPTTADPDGGPVESVGGAGTFFKLNDYGVGLRSTGWHNLSVTITDTAFSFYVDGALAETVANAFTLRSYDTVRLGSGISSANEAYFDNVHVETAPAPVVPEPGALSLAAMGLGMLLFIRKLRC
jgi:hypothetical protein